MIPTPVYQASPPFSSFSNCVTVHRWGNTTFAEMLPPWPPHRGQMVGAVGRCGCLSCAGQARLKPPLRRREATLRRLGIKPASPPSPGPISLLPPYLPAGYPNLREGMENAAGNPCSVPSAPASVTSLLHFPTSLTLTVNNYKFHVCCLVVTHCAIIRPTRRSHRWLNGRQRPCEPARSRGIHDTSHTIARSCGCCHPHGLHESNAAEDGDASSHSHDERRSGDKRNESHHTGNAHCHDCHGTANPAPSAVGCHACHTDGICQQPCRSRGNTSAGAARYTH